MVVLREHAEPDGGARPLGRGVARRLRAAERTDGDGQDDGRAEVRDCRTRRRRAPTGCRSRRTSTCSPPPGCCPTCTTSASTGSTSRRCSQAEPGSDHGYDVVDHDRVDPARGGAEGLAALSAEARRLGMGVLVDIVPNHVGVATPAANAWWWDVLEHGRASRYAARVRHRLGRRRRPGPAPGARRRRRCRDRDRTSAVEGELRYHDHRFPIAPGTRRRRRVHAAALRAGQLAARPTTS